MAVIVETGKPGFRDCVHLEKSMAVRAHEHRHRMILAQPGAGIKPGRSPGSQHSLAMAAQPKGRDDVRPAPE
jgi:hypothetical protein